MTLQIREIETVAEVEKVYSVLQELRTTLSFEDYLSIYKQAHLENGYRIACAFFEKECVGYMGYRVLYDFVHGKHLYIDDLVTASRFRSEGIGSQLLEYAEGRAKDLNCKILRLCTGVENERGKKFYEREGWNMRAVVFKKKI